MRFKFNSFHAFAFRVPQNSDTTQLIDYTQHKSVVSLRQLSPFILTRAILTYVLYFLY